MLARQTAQRFIRGRVLWGTLAKIILGCLIATQIFPVSPAHADTPTALSPGDRVLIAVNVLQIHPKPDNNSPVVGEVQAGAWTKYLQTATDAQNQIWFYLSTNVYGWVLGDLGGQSTVIPFTNKNVAQQFAAARAVIKASPRGTDGYIARAFGYEAQGKLVSALGDFTAAVKLAPQDGRIYGIRGLFEARHYQYRSAINDLLKADELGAKTPMLYSALADAYAGLEDNASAATYNSNAITLAPEWGFLVSQRAWLYHTSQQYDLAISLSAQAITLDPLLTPAYVRRALAYREQQHSTEFLNDLDKGLSLDPNCGDCYAWRGIYMDDDLGDDPGALAEFNKALDAEPYNSFAWETRGVWYAKNGSLRLATGDLWRAMALEPSDASIYYNLASIYASNGQYAESVAAYTTVINLGGRYSASAFLYRPQAYLSLDKYDLALADTQHWLQVSAQTSHPDFVAVANLVKGASLLYKGDYVNAGTAYHDAFTANPDFTLAYKTQGRGYRITPIRELLIAGLQTMAHAHPKDVKILLRLGNTAMEYGYWSEGIKAYQIVVSLQPNPDLAALIEDLTALFKIA